MIRRARPADVPAIYQLIRDLAEYELSLAEVTGSEEGLGRSLFCPEPAVFAHVAEHEGRVAGFALWYLSYSTWLCQHGMYLEDLYVTPELRGQGLGRDLLAELAAYAPRLRIVTHPALGATGMDQWTVHRMTGAPLRALDAGRASPG